MADIQRQQVGASFVRKPVIAKGRDPLVLVVADRRLDRVSDVVRSLRAG